MRTPWLEHRVIISDDMGRIDAIGEARAPGRLHREAYRQRTWLLREPCGEMFRGTRSPTRAAWWRAPASPRGNLMTNCLRCSTWHAGVRPFLRARPVEHVELVALAARRHQPLAHHHAAA
jgi:hypothetical protein